VRYFPSSRACTHDAANQLETALAFTGANAMFGKTRTWRMVGLRQMIIATEVAVTLVITYAAWLVLS